MPRLALMGLAMFMKVGKSLSVMVSNESEQKYAGQVWIDNDNEKIKTFTSQTSPTFLK